MVVLMLVYGLMGVVLFGSVKFGDNLGRHANFHNAFRAIILLSRIVTGSLCQRINLYAFYTMVIMASDFRRGLEQNHA